MNGILPYLISFILSAAIGAAGGYWGNRFTDQRRAQESRRREAQQFKEMVELMPDLIGEMTDDLSPSENAFFREFLVLPENTVMNLDSDTLIYTEKNQNRYLQKVRILEKNGLCRGHLERNGSSV